MLEPYGFHYAFTDAIIQHGRAKAKLKVFGDPDDNVQYAHGVFRQLNDMGHVQRDRKLFRNWDVW